MRPQEAERALRERYLDSTDRRLPYQQSPDLIVLLPSSSQLPHAHPSSHWTGPSTSLIPCESSEDPRVTARQPNRPDSSPRDLSRMQYHHHHHSASIDNGDTRNLGHSPPQLTAYSNYNPNHYRTGPLYSHSRIQDFHSQSQSGQAFHYQHNVQQQPRALLHSKILTGNMMQDQNHQIRSLGPKPNPTSDYNNFDNGVLRQSPSDKTFVSSASSTCSTQSSSGSGSLKQRILARPPDLDLSSIEDKNETKVNYQNQDERNSFETRSKSDNDLNSVNNRLPLATVARPTQYPAHFALGSLIQLSNGELKRVEDLTTDDFVSCAENSNDVGIDNSIVTRLREILENGSVTIDFLAGKQKNQVSVEAALEHPFFIIGKGWSSASPQHTMLRYQLPCQQLNVGDTCISLIIKTQPSRELPPDARDASSVLGNTAGEMLPPPVPPADRERHRSRSSSPADLRKSRASPLAHRHLNHSRFPPVTKQVVFSDEVVSHSPPPPLTSPDDHKNGSCETIQWENELKRVADKRSAIPELEHTDAKKPRLLS